MRGGRTQEQDEGQEGEEAQPKVEAKGRGVRERGGGDQRAGGTERMVQGTMGKLTTPSCLAKNGNKLRDDFAILRILRGKHDRGKLRIQGRQDNPRVSPLA